MLRPCPSPANLRDRHSCQRLLAVRSPCSYRPGAASKRCTATFTSPSCQLLFWTASLRPRLGPLLLDWAFDTCVRHTSTRGLGVSDAAPGRAKLENRAPTSCSRITREQDVLVHDAYHLRQASFGIPVIPYLPCYCEASSTWVPLVLRRSSHDPQDTKGATPCLIATMLSRLSAPHSP